MAFLIRGILNTVDGRNPAPLGNHGKPYRLLVFTGESNHWVSARWCPRFLDVATILNMAVAQKTGTKMGCPGKWKHGPKPAVCPSDRLILSHSHMSVVWFALRRSAKGPAPGKKEALLGGPCTNHPAEGNQTTGAWIFVWSSKSQPFCQEKPLQVKRLSSTAPPPPPPFDEAGEEAVGSLGGGWLDVEVRELEGLGGLG